MKIIDLTHKIDETTLNFRGNIDVNLKQFDYENAQAKQNLKSLIQLISHKWIRIT